MNINSKYATLQYLIKTLGIEFLKTQRHMFLEDPEFAYEYAMNIDRTARSDTRAAVCGEPEYAYFYAHDIDRKSHPDTRAAVCGDPKWAYWYALNVDHASRSDTRAAACGHPKWKQKYIEKFGE